MLHMQVHNRIILHVFEVCECSTHITQSGAEKAVGSSPFFFVREAWALRLS